MSIMTSKILKIVDSPKTNKKSKYLENKKLFSKKKKGYTMAKNSFLAKVTLK